MLTPRQFDRAALGVTLAGIAAAYLPGLSNGFVWLDHTEIEGGLRVVRQWSDLPLIVVGDDRGFTGYHRPVYNLLHTLDFLLWGLNPFGFHLSSLLLHLINVALVWLALGHAHMSLGRRIAICALWGAHPVNTAAVGLIHARADLFVTTMLGVIVLILVGTARSKHRIAWQLAALLPFAVALLTKETAAMLPLGVSLYVFLGERSDRGRHPTLWTGCAWIACAVAMLSRVGTPGAYQSEAGLAERLLTFSFVYNDYLASVLLPNKLFIGDTVIRFSALEPSRQAASLTISALLLAAQVLLWVRAPWSRVWLLLWNLWLVPVSQIVPILHFRADRFLYFPSLGLVGFTVESVVHALNIVRRPDPFVRLAAGTMLALVALTYGFRTAQRLRDFHDDGRLFTRELRDVPTYREGLSVLALAYDRHGQYAKADWLWRGALTPPNREFSYVDTGASIVNYSASLLAQGRTRDAVAFLERALPKVRNEHTQQEARYNLALAASRLGRFDKVVPSMVEYVRANPEDAGAQFILGRGAFHLGERQIARTAFSKYLTLRPNATDRPRVEQWLEELR